MKRRFLVFFLMLVCSRLFCFTLDELKKYPYEQTSYYGGSFSYELLDKVRVLEGNAKKFLSDYDNYYEYKNHVLTENEKTFFTEYFSCLPEKFKACFLENVYAVYFVEGMSYGGLTNFIFDEDQRMYCTVFFNIDTFKYNLDEWFEIRDNSIFTKTDEKNRIKVECSKEWKAFLHVLTHESAHVYDYINNVTPYADSFDGNPKSDSAYYKYWRDKSHPVKEFDNSLLSKFSYYNFGKRISFSKANDLINYISKTPFSTIYGAKNWQDDFAETVTFYYFQKAFGLDYKITCIKKGKTLSTYSLKQNANVHVWDSLCSELTGK